MHVHIDLHTGKSDVILTVFDFLKIKSITNLYQKCLLLVLFKIRCGMIANETTLHKKPNTL